MGCILQECYSQPVGKIQLLLGSQHKTCVVRHSTTRPSQQIPGVQNIPKKKKKLETTLCYSICLWEVILEIFICLMIGEITRVRAVTED